MSVLARLRLAGRYVARVHPLWVLAALLAPGPVAAAVAGGLGWWQAAAALGSLAFMAGWGSVLTVSRVAHRVRLAQARDAPPNY